MSCYITVYKAGRPAFVGLARSALELLNTTRRSGRRAGCSVQKPKASYMRVHEAYHRALYI